MTDPNKGYINYLPAIKTLTVNYGEAVTDHMIQVVYSAEYGPNRKQPVVWVHIQDDDRDGWARLTLEALDDLITELMYAKQQIGGDT